MAKKFMVEYRKEIAAILSILGVIGLLISIAGSFFDENAPPFIYSFYLVSKPLGNWNLWILLISPVALIIGVWWLYDYFKKVKKLEKYLSENSKSKFIRNIEDVQYLGWSLPQKYEDMVLEKMDEFKIKS